MSARDFLFYLILGGTGKLCGFPDSLTDRFLVSRMLLRLTELKLPLHHTEAELTSAILKRLDLPPDKLAGFSVRRRGYDARRKTAIAFIYTVDIELHDSAENPAILERLLADRNISPAPDTRYFNPT